MDRFPIFQIAHPVDPSTHGARGHRLVSGSIIAPMSSSNARPRKVALAVYKLKRI